MNVISGNAISKNGRGIKFGSSCKNNIISDNNISSNIYDGVFISFSSSNNNLFYHNNFINNTQNAYDESTNTWYNKTLQQGNYWDDYDDLDADGNGVGDTPYGIPGGHNQDLYPRGYFKKEDGGTEDENGTSGFEFAFLIIVILSLVLMKRKRNKK